MTTDYASIIKTEPDAKRMRDEIADGIGQAQDIAQNAVDTANAAKTTADNANSRVDEIVKGTGASDSAEVADAHHDNITGTNYDSLSKRLDAQSSQMAEKSNLAVSSTEPSDYKENTLWCNVVGNSINLDSNPNVGDITYQQI